MQPKRRLNLGRPLGFPLYAHPSWVPAAALLIAHLSVTVYGGHELPIAVGLGALTTIAVFGSVVAHEVAHAIAARRTGIELAGTTLYLFGGVHRFADDPGRPRKEISFAFSGPIGSAVIGAALLIAATQLRGIAFDVAWTAGLANLALAGVNVLPGLPLDGGRALTALTSPTPHARDFSVQRSARIGWIMGAALTAIGAWYFWSGLPVLEDASPGLMLAVTGVMVALVSVSIRRASAVARNVMDGSVGAWARPFAGRVPIDAPVPSGGGPFAVSEDGRLAGIVYGSSGGELARDVMTRWRPDLALPASAPLARAIERMAASGTGVVVVLDAKGVVSGVLSEEALRDRLRGARGVDGAKRSDHPIGKAKA